MKSLFAIIAFWFFVTAASAQISEIQVAQPDPNKPLQTIEVSCGKCKLGLPGKSCDLAVRIAGKAYYADGANIDAFGDAHEHDGMCNAIRKAEVQGDVVDNRFKISYIKLLPETKKEAAKKQ